MPTTPEKIPASALLAAVKLASKFVGSRSSMPILSCVRLTIVEGGIILETNDLTISTKIEFGTCAGHAPAVAVNAKNFIQILETTASGARGELPIELTPDATKKKLSLRVGTRTADVKLEDADDFPSAPTVEKGALQTYDLRTLEPALDYLEPAITADSTLYNLCGYFFDGGDEATAPIVTTSGYRIHLAHGLPRLAPGTGCLVPTAFPKAVFAAAKLIRTKSVTTETQGESHPVEYDKHGQKVNPLPALSHWTVLGGIDGLPVRVELTVRLVEGQFPDYKQAIPETNDDCAVFDCSRETLLDAAKSAKRLDARIELRIEDQQLFWSAKKADLGGISDVLGPCYGRDRRALLSAEHLLAACQIPEVSTSGSVGATPLRLTLIDELSPITIEAGDYAAIVATCRYHH